MPRKGFAPIFVIIIVALALVLGGGPLYYAKKISAPKPVACTQDAKQCPDGSYVGRVGPNCEFAICLNSTSTQLVDISHWKTYRNEKYGFEVKYPEDWIFEQTKFQDQETFNISSVAIGSREPIAVISIMPDTKLDHDLGEPKITDITFAGLKARQLEWTDEKWIQIVNIRKNWSTDNRIQIGFGNSEIKDQKSTIVDQILSTFRFIGQDASATGVLVGKVSIGPICPVERVGVPCPVPPEAYAAREFLVLAADKKQVASFYADARGIYSISLPPGVYTVVSAKTSIGFISKDLPHTVKIQAGQPVILDIGVDTGIR